MSSWLAATLRNVGELLLMWNAAFDAGYATALGKPVNSPGDRLTGGGDRSSTGVGDPPIGWDSASDPLKY